MSIILDENMSKRAASEANSSVEIQKRYRGASKTCAWDGQALCVARGSGRAAGPARNTDYANRDFEIGEPAAVCDGLRSGGDCEGFEGVRCLAIRRRIVIWEGDAGGA